MQRRTSSSRSSAALWISSGSASSGRQTSQKSNMPSRRQSLAMRGSGSRLPNVISVFGNIFLARSDR